MVAIALSMVVAMVLLGGCYGGFNGVAKLLLCFF